MRTTKKLRTADKTNSDKKRLFKSIAGYCKSCLVMYLIKYKINVTNPGKTNTHCCVIHTLFVLIVKA